MFDSAGGHEILTRRGFKKFSGVISRIVYFVLVESQPYFETLNSGYGFRHRCRRRSRSRRRLNRRRNRSRRRLNRRRSGCGCGLRDNGRWCGRWCRCRDHWLRCRRRRRSRHRLNRCRRRRGCGCRFCGCRCDGLHRGRDWNWRGSTGTGGASQQRGRAPAVGAAVAAAWSARPACRGTRGAHRMGWNRSRRSHRPIRRCAASRREGRRTVDWPRMCARCDTPCVPDSCKSTTA